MGARMVTLPCDVGDTVYRVKKRGSIIEVLPREVVSITYRHDCRGKARWEIFSTSSDILGVSVFLTEEDANAYITKMKEVKVK